MSETARRTGNGGWSCSVPDGPISGPMHDYAIDIAVCMQHLPQNIFQKANPALKGLLAEIDRVRELENYYVPRSE